MPAPRRSGVRVAVIRAKSSAQSSTVRAMGPAVSKRRQSGRIPVPGTAP